MWEQNINKMVVTVTDAVRIIHIQLLNACKHILPLSLSLSLADYSLIFATSCNTGKMRAHVMQMEE